MVSFRAPFSKKYYSLRCFFLCPVCAVTYPDPKKILEERVLKRIMPHLIAGAIRYSSSLAMMTARKRSIWQWRRQFAIYQLPMAQSTRRFRHGALLSRQSPLDTKAQGLQQQINANLNSFCSATKHFPLQINQQIL